MSNTIGDVQATAQDNIQRTMSGLKDGVASATAGIEQAQATMRDGMQKAMKTAEELFSFSQGNVEAVTRSSQILATGMQDLSHSIAATMRASLDDTMGVFKAMSAVKSVREAMDLQTGLFRTAFERAVSQTSQVTDSTRWLRICSAVALNAPGLTKFKNRGPGGDCTRALRIWKQPFSHPSAIRYAGPMRSHAARTTP